MHAQVSTLMFEAGLVFGSSLLWAGRLVFGAGRKAGILPPEKDALPRVDFVGFGLVLGSDGKRIRTRDEGAVRDLAVQNL